MTVQRFETTARLSQATAAGGFVFLTGQVADGDGTGAQTRAVLARIDELLAAAGCDRRAWLSATIYLADLADFAAMNAVWDTWFPPGCAPARTTLRADLLKPEYRIEIQVVAYRGGA